MTISIQYSPSNLMLQNSINKSTNTLNESLTKLSSGYKINKAADDSAGLYISSNLNTAVRGYAVVNQNSQNALSYLNLASSSLSGMTDILSRMRDLAVTASSETYDDNSRIAMQSEADKLTEQLSNTKSSTEFNGIKIFENNTPAADNTGTTGAVGTYSVHTFSEVDANTQGYTIIRTEEDLKAINTNSTTLSGKYVLMNDIELTGDWTPIGSYVVGSNDYSNVFKGQFNGNGYTVSNVKIDQSSINYTTGFFGCVDGENAKVENLNLENVDVKGKGYTGGLIGLLNNEAKVDNCSLSGNIDGNTAGGLVGASYSSTISNCYAISNVTGKGNYTGGLVGYNYNGSTIKSCYATGTVTSIGRNTGGLVGNNCEYATISNCYATSSVKGNGEQTGGLVGQNDTNSNVLNSYATGTVTGLGGNVGGLVGINYFNSTISNCYSTGDVEGSGSHIGGFCGSNRNKSGSDRSTGSLIENCYSTGFVKGSGGFIGYTCYSDIKSSFYNSDKTSNLKAINYAQPNTCENDVTGLKTNQFNDDTIFKNAGWNTKNWYFETSGTPKCLSQKTAKNIKEFQIGIDEKRNSVITVATGLDIKDFRVNLSTRENALKSIDKIDSMLNIMMEKTTEIGASQNKVESIMNSQELRKNTLTAAKSTILDADIAEESSKYVNAQIRQQCSSALMSQLRNSNPSLIMQLINATKM